MPFFRLFHRNPLKNLDLGKLKKTRLELQRQSDDLIRDIDTLGKEYELVRQQGAAAKSAVEKNSIARRMESLDKSRTSKTRTQNDIDLRLAFINNLIIIGERREDLKSIGAWDYLAGLTEEQLEKDVINLQLADQDEDTRLKNIAALTEGPQAAPVVEEGLGRYLDEIDAQKNKEALKAAEEGEAAASAEAAARERAVLDAWKEAEIGIKRPEPAPREPEKEKRLEEA
ncbi:MAG: hypothetical protein HY673_09530 [Chloroflexi bacterium]|nr:hypothetical protein [Chloroflexota bacterium]